MASIALLTALIFSFVSVRAPPAQDGAVDALTDTCLASYTFYSDSGSTFNDSSGQNNKAISSVDSQSNPTVTISAMGARLSGSSYIKLPPNGVKSQTVELKNSFYISGWFYPSSSGPLFYRQADLRMLVKVYTLNAVLFVAVADEDGNTKQYNSATNYIELNIWHYLEIEVRQHDSHHHIAAYDNTVEIIQQGSTSSVFKDQLSSSLMYIGYDGNQYWQGYVFMFKLFTGDSMTLKESLISCSTNKCSACLGTLVCACSNGGSSTSCACSPGFYLSSNKCVACSSPCVTCVTAAECTSCSNNANVVASCSCGSDQYLSASNICVDCSPALCTSCNQTGCLTCSNNANVVASCSCGSDQYLSASNMCVDCSPALCTSCNQTGCLTCSNNANVVASCSCGSDQYLSASNMCVDCSPALCTSCNQTGCLTCSNNAANISDCTCASHQTASSGACISCPENCLSCSGPTSCSTCEPEYTLISGICHTCDPNCVDCRGTDDCQTCRVAYYALAGQCLSCPQFCSACSGPDMCSGCDSTFALAQGRCVCADSYELTGSVCVLNQLTLTITKQKDSLLLAFSEVLQEDLSADYIKTSYFEPGAQSFEVQIDRISGQEYQLRIQHTEVPKEVTGLYLQFAGVSGESSSQLQSNSIQVPTTQSEAETLLTAEEAQEPEEMLGGQSAEEAGTNTLAIGGSVSLGLSFISANPATLWIFLNTVIMINYMPLQNVGMPLRFRNFSKALGLDLIRLVPFLKDERAFNDTTEATSPKQWRDYGFVTTDLVSNIMVFLVLTGLGVGCLLLLGLCRACTSGRCRDFMQRRIADLRWSYFLRVWVLSYVKIMVGSVLSIGAVILTQIDDEGYNVKQVMSLVLLVFAAVSVGLLVGLTYKHRLTIAVGGEAIKSFGALFAEFKCDRGFGSMLFYPLFFVRRFCYIIGLYYLEAAPLVQVVMNAGLSAVVLGYLLAFRPFRDSTANFVNIATEGVVTGMFGLSGLFLLDLGREVEDVISLVMIGGCAGIVLAIVGSLIFKIGLAVKEWRERRRVGRETDTNTTKIYPLPRAQENRAARTSDPLFAKGVYKIAL